jgi:hypothetical protein
MNQPTLTREERSCLQSWFRHAIAKLEVEEATASFIRSRAIIEGKFDGHSAVVPRRRSKRTTVTAHTKELVSV